jgi:hypothetical protein
VARAVLQENGLDARFEDLVVKGLRGLGGILPGGRATELSRGEDNHQQQKECCNLFCENSRLHKSPPRGKSQTPRHCQNLLSAIFFECRIRLQSVRF